MYKSAFIFPKDLTQKIWIVSTVYQAMPVLKRPSIQSPGRPRSSADFSGLQDALKPWCKGTNFFTYTSERNIKSKDVEKLKLYLPHLQRVQSVHRTWSFSLKTIDAALRALNEDLGFIYKHNFSQKELLCKCRWFDLFVRHPSISLMNFMQPPCKEMCLVSEKEAANWAATRALKLQAMFRHVAQEALNCRKWLPKVFQRSNFQQSFIFDTSIVCFHFKMLL